VCIQERVSLQQQALERQFLVDEHQVCKQKVEEHNVTYVRGNELLLQVLLNQKQILKSLLYSGFYQKGTRALTLQIFFYFCSSCKTLWHLSRRHWKRHTF
jgi:hypothetical protein